ncbi:MAG: protein-glutamate O-methyltransferase CheR [Saccharospirillaceae bacterium]|nr:protein-glutamate O-methyltransferase CheR [Pseudomonadales bacterium]NRB80215.1 protein-glutamate O-methyltransferase CheR [Saccharospirillaceae bacterium]
MQKPPSNAYHDFTEYLQQKSGITLGSEKEYLVNSRLKHIMFENGIVKLDDLLKQLKLNSNLCSRVIDAMTTNETLWFRDSHPFEILKNRIIPELLKANKHSTIRIWSAACSTGQEPFSISMAFDEYKNKHPNFNLNFNTFATDLSSKVLESAKKGIYHELAIERGLSKSAKQKYFTEMDDGYWKINTEMMKNVKFESINLKDNLSRAGQFEVIFCRNVLIYFTNELKREILVKLHKQLKPGGYLFIGAGESMLDLSDYFELIHFKPGIVYKKK